MPDLPPGHQIESAPRGRRARPSTRRAVAMTAAMNVAMAGSASIAGLLIARQLGPTGRGEYAAVLAWFGVALVVGELGQPAALCYFVASDGPRGRDYVATTRRLMLVTGSVIAAIGWALAPVLARQDNTLTTAYRLMFATCILSFVGSSYLFALQARTITYWNAARLVQPALYLAVTMALALIGVLSVLAALLSLVGTIFVQVVVAWVLCRRVDLHGGRFDRRLAQPLLRYGGSQIAANAPMAVNTRLDQVILAAYAPYQLLGLYAVAVSITSLALPVVAAIGYVVFPRIAERRGDSTVILQRQAVRASLILSAGLMIVIAALTPWALPTLFGRAYAQAVPLVWVLCVGGVFLASGQVIGDLLRGRGQPLLVAVAQVVGMICTVVLLLALLPLLGALGAAIASTVAYVTTFVVLVAALRRPGRTSLDRQIPLSTNDVL